MKKFLLIQLIVALAVTATAQDCYEPLNNFGISAHYVFGKGMGLSFGNIGRESNWSFLLSGEYVSTGTGKKDSASLIMGPKVLYRFARTESCYFQAVVYPAIVGVRLDLSFGARAMCIVGRRVAIFSEPLFWMKRKGQVSAGVVAVL